MDWLTGIKDLGFPAMISLALLYVLTVRIEAFHKSIDDLRDEIQEIRRDLGEMRENYILRRLPPKE